MRLVVQILKDQLRFLFFRGLSPAIGTRWRAYLAFGLSVTWLAGIGRYWDHSAAHLWQMLGFGSLAYVFVLALLLWLLIAPLGPQRWSYRNVLLFVTLTSAPALLYAIPVERFMPLRDAQSANAWFLLAVAAWRVALYAWYLRAVAKLSMLRTVVSVVLPLTLIVAALAVLNLEHAVFAIMGGIRGGTPHDGAYTIIWMLSLLSTILAPLFGLAYCAIVFSDWRNKRGLFTLRGASG